MKTVVIGLVGAVLDRSVGPRRWDQWRPTVDVCRHDDLVVDRFALLFSPRDRALASLVADDIRTVSPETEVAPHEIRFDDPWDFGEVYERLHDFALSFP